MIIQNQRALLVYDVPPLAPIATPPARIVPQVAHPIRTYPTGRHKVRTTNQASVDFLDLRYTHGDGIFDRYRIERASPNDPSSPFVPVMDSGGLELRPEGGYDMTYCAIRAPRACLGNVFTMGYRTGWYDPDIEAQADRRDAYFSDDEWEPEDYTEEIDEAIGRENDQAGVFVHVEHRDQERDASESGRYPASIVELLDRSDAAWGHRELSFVDFCPASGRLCAVVAENGPRRLLVFDYLPASM